MEIKLMCKDLDKQWLSWERVQVIIVMVTGESHSGLTFKMGPEKLLSEGIHTACAVAKVEARRFHKPSKSVILLQLISHYFNVSRHFLSGDRPQDSLRPSVYVQIEADMLGPVSSLIPSSIQLAAFFPVYNMLSLESDA